MNRRHFIKEGIVFTLGTAGMIINAQEPIKSPRKVYVGVQLYSVRDQAAKNLPAVLRSIKAMGYEGVEFAGYYGWSAKEIAAMLRDTGLKCCGTHTGIETLLGDELPKTVEFNQTIGNPYLIVPSLPPKYTNSADAWKQSADLFTQLAEKLKSSGMRLGYHCHGEDFKPADGSTGWDIFFNRVSKEVIMQLDTGNAASAGVNPLAVLKRYPGRAVTVHLKPFSKSTPGAVIGEDELPWDQILTWCEERGGTEWYIVEYEDPKYSGMEGIYKCLLGLCKLGRCGGREKL